jgi:hypothetical protein
MVSQEVDTKEVVSQEVASKEEEEVSNQAAPAQAEEEAVVTQELPRVRWDFQAVTQVGEVI